MEGLPPAIEAAAPARVNGLELGFATRSASGGKRLQNLSGSREHRRAIAESATVCKAGDRVFL